MRHPAARLLRRVWRLAVHASRRRSSFSPKQKPRAGVDAAATPYSICHLLLRFSKVARDRRARTPMK